MKNELALNDEKELTDNQQRFLDAYFDIPSDQDLEAGLPTTFCNARASMIAAGYSEKTNPFLVLKGLQEEIRERTELLLTINGPQAMASLFEIMANPANRANPIKLQVAKEILDRGGIGHNTRKGDNVGEQTNITNNIVLLPPKREDDNPSDDRFLDDVEYEEIKQQQE